jgi:hypothetical protein
LGRRSVSPGARDADLPEHLPQDDLDVLVAQGHALGTVDVLDLFQHVDVEVFLAR